MDPRSSPPFRHLTARTQAFSIQALSEEMLGFLRALKPMDSFEMFGKRCVACHAAPSDPLFRYLRTSEKHLADEIRVAGEKLAERIGARTSSEQVQNSLTSGTGLS
jgi:hypothetical protein